MTNDNDPDEPTLPGPDYDPRPTENDAGSLADYHRTEPQVDLATRATLRGDPLVLYHGTTASFQRLSVPDDTKSIGLHFGTVEQAHCFTGASGCSESRIVPALLTIDNPLVVRDTVYWDRPGCFADVLPRQGSDLVDKSEPFGWSVETFTKEQREELALRMMGQPHCINGRFHRAGPLRAFFDDIGYDSVIYKNDWEGVGWSVFVWDDERIRPLYSAAASTSMEGSRTNRSAPTD